MKRELDEDDIYAVKNSMQSAQNTDAFEKQWRIELQNKNPSIVRVMFKLYGSEILLTTFFYGILSAMVR